MLTRIIEFSIRNKLLIGLFTLILLVYGIVELRRLPMNERRTQDCFVHVFVIVVAAQHGTGIAWASVVLCRIVILP